MHRSSAGARDVAATAVSARWGCNVSGDGCGDGNGDGVEVEGTEEILGFRVNLNAVARVKRGNLGHVVILALTLLLLELEGDTTYGAALNTLHQMGGEARNLVAQAFGRDDSHLINNTLVGVEIKGEARVVFLNENTGSPLDGLGANATHFVSVCRKVLTLRSIQVSLNGKIMNKDIKNRVTDS